MATNDLRPGQYKRIGRIAENNPERANRVAERMTTRSEREEKGKAIADKYSSSAKVNRQKDLTSSMERGVKSTDYNSINFKNQDIDKFSTKFGNGEKPQAVKFP